jgi:glycosyltransferase involved in cell wall biosynthesis
VVRPISPSSGCSSAGPTAWCSSRITSGSTYEKKIGTPRASWRLIHNGLRENEFEPVVDAADAVDFLYIGMMRDLKGPDVFIEALRRAEQLAGRPLRGVMVGDGDDKPRYQARIDMLGLGERVKMLDAMPARKAFAMARTVVIPSRAESMPYIVLEAVAAGKPVISTKVGGIPEILGADFAGFVPPGDIEALATAMAHAISDPDWLSRAMQCRKWQGSEPVSLRRQWQTG